MALQIGAAMLKPYVPYMILGALVVLGLSIAHRRYYNRRWYQQLKEPSCLRLLSLWYGGSCCTRILFRVCRRYCGNRRGATGAASQGRQSRHLPAEPSNRAYDGSRRSFAHVDLRHAEAWLLWRGANSRL